VTAGSHSVGGVAGEDDHLLPSAVQHFPDSRETGLSQSVDQSHTDADGRRRVSQHRHLRSTSLPAGPCAVITRHLGSHVDMQTHAASTLHTTVTY